MKAGSAFITPLSGLALELLRPHLKADPDSPALHHLPAGTLHEAAQRLVAGLAMERWTPHDLRRTAATILDRAGYSLEQIGALLAHTRKGVTAVYARWDKFDLRREMATAVELSLRETLDSAPATPSRPQPRPTRRNSTTRGRPWSRPFPFGPPPGAAMPTHRLAKGQWPVASRDVGLGLRPPAPLGSASRLATGTMGSSHDQRS